MFPPRALWIPRAYCSEVRFDVALAAPANWVNVCLDQVQEKLLLFGACVHVCVCSILVPDSLTYHVMF